ncbi:MAG: hypothetical protein V7K77_31235 [Nostoc sp.]|uniref:hypothetical protein n=1 Tax=Nostoc sp. TaxID=1180 RepID=UPI002FF9A394
MRPTDPRLLQEVGDLVYVRLIQVLNLYARCDVYDGRNCCTTRCCGQVVAIAPNLGYNDTL